MNRRILNITLAAAALSFFSCSDDEKSALVIPATYDATTYTANTADEQVLLTNLTNLSNEAKKGRINGTEVTSDVLNQKYTAGTPSLKSKTTTYYAGKLEDWFVELADASGETYTPAAPEEGDKGGTYGGYLFSENGVEKEQLIEKGQFGAVFYNHAVALIKGQRTPDLADKLIASFGANPTFPNSNSGNVTTPDKFLAGYAARRDKNDGTGVYTKMRDAFIKLQAALKAGDDYRKEQNEAIKVIEENWEKANAATMINYCHSVVSKLSATSPSEADYASSLHSLSECIGFIHGWRTIADDHKIVTDAQIDEILVLLNAPANGTATAYTFVTERETEVLQVQQVITKLKGIYGFTDQEIEDFKMNWVAEQGR